MVSEDVIKANVQAARKLREEREERRKRTKRISQIKSLYGLTLEQFEDLMDSVGSSCEICKTPLKVGGKKGDTDSACIDHCHSTGVIRGVLCRKCNAAIGALGDTTSSVQRAVSYLEKTLVRRF